MGISLGWVALFVAGVTGAPPVDRNAAPIAYTVKMVEADGVGWRESVYSRLKPVTRQGAASVWTLPKSAARQITQGMSKNASGAVFEGTRAMALSGSAAVIQVRENRKFITQVAWNGEEAAANNSPEDVRVGWHTTIVGRMIDQGILVKMVLEDTQVRAVHKVSVKSALGAQATKAGDAVSRASTFPASPFDAACSANYNPTKARVSAFMDKAMEAYKVANYADCIAFARRALEVEPGELAAEILIIQARNPSVYKAETKDDLPHCAGARFEVDAADCQQILDPAVIESAQGCPQLGDFASAAHVAGKDALELPEIANQEILGEWLIPNGDCLLVSFGPYTVADKDGKAVTRERLAFIEADSQPGAMGSQQAMMPAPGYFVPSPAPMGPPVEVYVPYGPDGRMLYGTPPPSVPPPPVPGFVPAPVSPFMSPDVQGVPPAMDVPAMAPKVARRTRAYPPAPAVPAPATGMPAVPERSYPQGVHVDGTKAKLPPLPDDEMDDDSAESESAEPLPSPQTKQPRKPKAEPAKDSGATKASFNQPKSSTVFLPSVFLPGASVGFQFLLPVKPLSLKLPFNQRLEVEIFGRVVPDTRMQTADK